MDVSKYKLLSAAMVAAAAISLSACSDDDDDDNNNNPPVNDTSFQEEFSTSANYQNVLDAAAAFGIDADTLAAITTETTTTAGDGPFTTPAGNSVTPADYFGAVDPSAADPDDDPATAGPFWDGWTIRNANIAGNLPGTPAEFHPLADNMPGGTGTTITPAVTNDCAAKGTGLGDGGTVSILGQTWEVCVIVDGDLDGIFTLSNDHVYVLAGTVQVGNGDVEGAFDDATVNNDELTIEAGTQIYGITVDGGSLENTASLVITRGSTIQALGTADAPIIFGAVEGDAAQVGIGDVITDADPEDLGDRGQWGSLVISGYGLINNGDDNDQTTTEASPDGITRWFGGTDNTDSSGTIEYVVLAETGAEFRPDEEVQGLTIEAAGSGTTISHVQITNSDDDGIEWFGGAADADHVVIQSNTDDALDIDLGYQGVIQFALVIQGDQNGDYGIESDNNGSAFGATPKTSPVIANITILGNFGNGGAADANTAGALHREGFGGQVYRSVYSDISASGLSTGAFELGCLDVDNELDEDLAYGDVIFNCSPNALVDDDDS